MGKEYLKFNGYYFRYKKCGVVVLVFLVYIIFSVFFF